MAKSTANRRRPDPAKTRAAAIQGAKRALKVMGVVALTAGAALLVKFGGGAVRTWFATSPTFAVDTVDVDGNVNAARDSVLSLADIRKGENIFDVDLDAVAKAIQNNPWVEDVEVRRHLPRRIHIRLTEHVPAVLVDMGGLYYADDGGKAFKKVEGGDQVDLPLLRGISRETYSSKPLESEALIREGIAVAALYASAGLDGKLPLSDIEIDEVEGLTLRCGEGATAIRLGRGDYQAKMVRLGRVFAELKSRGATALVIRLDNRTSPDRVAVQLDRSSVGLFL